MASSPTLTIPFVAQQRQISQSAYEALAWWEVEGGGCEMLGGRDGLAGGTWLASITDGRIAFLTNVQEVQSILQAKSRGHLPVCFLESKKHPSEFAEELVKDADQY